MFVQSCFSCNVFYEANHLSNVVLVLLQIEVSFKCPSSVSQVSLKCLSSGYDILHIYIYEYDILHI